MSLRKQSVNKDMSASSILDPVTRCQLRRLYGVEYYSNVWIKRIGGYLEGNRCGPSLNKYPTIYQDTL
jgi:hypothetical protein